MKIKKQLILFFMTFILAGYVNLHSIEVKNIGGIEMVYIPEGTFMMGTPIRKDYKNRIIDPDQALHKVELSSFWIGKYEITQKQYEEIMGNNPSHFKGVNNPVECVSWNDAIKFCNKLSEKNGLQPYYKIESGIFSDTVTIIGGNGFRLPFEAEWEYSCKAGNTPLNYKLINDYMWYAGNSNKKTHLVGQKTPNSFGLYDMLGNVSELCWDWYDKNYYEISPLKNPKGPDNGEKRVEKGFDYRMDVLYAAARGWAKPGARHDGRGFRIVVSQMN